MKVLNEARHNLVKSRQRVADRHNRDRIPQPFKVGDSVYLMNHPVSHFCRKIAAKLSPRWRGPFRIQSFFTPVTVRLVLLRSNRFVSKAHVSQLKLATFQ